MRTIFTGSSRQWSGQQMRPSARAPVMPPPSPPMAIPDPPVVPVQKVRPPLPPALNVPTATLPEWDADVERGRQQGVFTKTWTITPQLAEAIVNKNPDNRSLSVQRGMRRLTDAMVKGRWQHNGESIKIDRDGFLNDGQNRLIACIEANRPFVSEVTFGLTRDSRNTVDIGISRTVQHLLQMGGYSQTAEIAGGARVAMIYERDGTLNLTNTDIVPQADEVVAWVAAHPEFVEEDVLTVRRLYQNVKIPKGVTAGLHYLFRKRNPEATDAFFERLRYGVWPGVTASDPVHRLLEYITNHGKFTGRDGHTEYAAVLIKAFNMMRRNEKISNLVWRRSGPRAEDFPTIE